MPTVTLKFKTAIELSGGTIEQEDGYTLVSGSDIGLEHYPIWEESARQPLNGMIVDRYMNYEIGHETIDEFKRALRSRMNEIMPYYIDLHRSTQIEFEPLINVDVQTTGTATGSDEATTISESDAESTQTGESNSENESKSRTVSSDFPQTMLNNSSDYASGAADATSRSTTGGTTTDHAESTNTATDRREANTAQDTLSHTKGYQGNPSDMLERYRATLLNINVMIIDDLSDLFMILWNNGDAYVSRNDYLYGWW